jgi:hypothetical protein
LNISEIKYPVGLNKLNTKIYVALSVSRIILTTRISYYNVGCWHIYEISSFYEGQNSDCGRLGFATA